MAKPKRGRGARKARYSSERPNPVDIHVGGRVRLRRTMLGMSQEKLGEAIGLTFQQVQKYERGTNRIGSSRLFELSRVLDVPITFFFDDMAPQVASKSHRASAGLAEKAGPAYETETLARRETLELMRNYYQVVDPTVRKRIFELVKALARATGGKKGKK
ncbi:MAG: helix-turn-helix transcriptional regulator [Alphaproteobacteria bacterium]|nr:helix-turn-helix transcriptional regulator [Alphaproteobacteria bacterium]